ncbi:MAG: hypothetical protein PHI36_06140 [Bacteroidales bacterium]|nr:hypothetical protein [Bacteroidales bacterium]MDL2228162.1 transporter [Odoribacter sp. OttesenSCG-928-L07]MDL2239751.1 transporter [Bacteroidales bacterium OttesenSCG-928-L14]MDL2241072.1 transporter [Bacteroidales bacterium OttesenSCG-928-K22]
MRNIFLKILLCTAIISLSFNHSFGQCCGAGNPISVSGLDNTTDKNNLKIGLNYRYNYSNRYFENTKKTDIDFPAVLDNSNYNYLSLNVGYGITERLSVKADLGFYINKTENFKHEGFDNLTAHGLGDLDINISYKAYLNKKKGIELAPFVSVKFPIGKFDQEVDDIKLPITMQPSSGSFRYTGGIFFYANLPNDFFLTSFNFFEYAQRIKSKNFDYKFGNTLYLSVDANYKAFRFLTVGLQAGYEYKGRSQRENNQELYGTGYHVISLTPHLTFKIKQTYIACSGEIPVFHKVEEIQLVNTFALRLSVIQNIQFKNKKDRQKQKENDACCPNPIN